LAQRTDRYDECSRSMAGGSPWLSGAALSCRFRAARPAPRSRSVDQVADARHRLPGETNLSWHPPHRHFVRIAWAAVALACVVIVFGGFVRLSNAGLACPDGPTCYGKATWPVHGHEIDAANEAFPQRAVESSKAWREQ